MPASSRGFQALSNSHCYALCAALKILTTRPKTVKRRKQVIKKRRTAKGKRAAKGKKRATKSKKKRK